MTDLAKDEILCSLCFQTRHEGDCAPCPCPACGTPMPEGFETLWLIRMQFVCSEKCARRLA